MQALAGAALWHTVNKSHYMYVAVHCYTVQALEETRFYASGTVHTDLCISLLVGSY